MLQNHLSNLIALKSRIHLIHYNLDHKPSEIRSEAKVTEALLNRPNSISIWGIINRVILGQ